LIERLPEAWHLKALNTFGPNPCQNEHPTTNHGLDDGFLMNFRRAVKYFWQTNVLGEVFEIASNKLYLGVFLSIRMLIFWAT
jgi:hypothetical protein